MPSNVNRNTPALARTRTLRGADADSAAARNERWSRRARDGAADDAQADNENGESPFVERGCRTCASQPTSATIGRGKFPKKILT